MELARGINLKKSIRRVREAILLHLPALLAVLLFLLAAELFLNANAKQVTYEFDKGIESVLKALSIYAGILLVLTFAWLCFAKLRGETLRRIVLWLRSHDWVELFLLRIPLAFFVVLLSGHLYVKFKVNIPAFNSYSWDHFFAEVDRALFLGLDPWTITHSVFSGFEVSLLIDNLYLLWLLEMQVVTVAAACLALRDPLRLAYLLAFTSSGALCGTMLAIVMPAAGPVYMEALTGDLSFAPLMERLQALGGENGLRALAIQEYLWEGYTNPAVDPVGISAFPSMHVQYAMLFTLFVYALNRPLGWVLALYTAIIFIGSVHLGWHYAIDGIVGVLLAIVVWSASLQVSRWWLDRLEPHGLAPDGESSLAAE